MQMSPKVRHFLLGMAFVHSSLVSAFIVRFLVLAFIEKIGSGPIYWQVVHYTLLGYRNSILPSLIVGYVVLYARDKWIKSLAPARTYWTSFICISVFFGIMVLIGVSLSSHFAFAWRTWLLAYWFCVTFYSLTSLISRLDKGMRQRLMYNPVWHYLFDAAVIASSLFLSYIVRFDGLPPQSFLRQCILLSPYPVLLYLGMNKIWRVYACVWRFTGVKEALGLLLSVTSSGLIALLLRILVLPHIPSLQIPFGVLLVHPPLTFIGLLGTRMLRRVQYHYVQRDKIRSLSPAKEKRVLLVGAGNAGMMLVRELESHRNFKIVGFLDDDRRKQGSVISGIRVLGTTRDAAAMIRERDAHEVIFCMPTAPKSVLRRVAADCAALGIPTSSVPSLSEIVLGKVKVDKLRPVKMEDLLGRASVELTSNHYDLIQDYSDRRILVTGAAGSIGSELVRQLKELHPSKLFLMDKDENGLYEVGLEIREDFAGDVVEIIADIRDRNRLARVFQRWQPETVFHAAAYKHVPMMEYHPWESVSNNILGTKNLADLACEHHLRSFLLISTDKAVNPTSVMGASKRVAEMIVRYTAIRAKGTTRFCSVRFGNVLGSRASVVPLFQKRIAEGKNIQVTHPAIMRYFMTIPEAVQLVIQAGTLGELGETFVLDMGDPVKIVDLAKELIEQSGLTLGRDIEIEFTGLRPGEKLYEELLTGGDSSAKNTKYPKIFVDEPIQYDWSVLENALRSFEEAAREEDIQRIYDTFYALNIGYQRKTTSTPASNAGL